MVNESQLSADRQEAEATRAVWALGDYHRFAVSTIWSIGPLLVDECGISRGQRLLDVAAGTGNVAIRAAEAGAEVVALDLTPENFAAGQRAAAERGVTVEWIEGNAEALPFDDGTFDVVTSCFGVIFAPHHQRAADELLRVCRPGGTIALANFAPRGTSAAFFQLLGGYLPAAPDAEPPLAWGTEEHVKALFGNRVDALTVTSREYTETATTPEAYQSLFFETFGPVIAVRNHLSQTPSGTDQFDQEFASFIAENNTGEAGGPATYRYPYVTVLAKKRA